MTVSTIAAGLPLSAAGTEFQASSPTTPSTVQTSRLIARLSKFIANTSYGAIPPKAIDTAKVAIWIASMASGVTSNFGTMTKPLHVGNAARNGVLAARLAKTGFTANPQTLEEETGFSIPTIREENPMSGSLTI